MTLDEAREVIRRHDPDLVDMLDLWMPLPEPTEHYEAVSITEADYRKLEVKDPTLMYLITV